MNRQLTGHHIANRSLVRCTDHDSQDKNSVGSPDRLPKVPVRAIRSIRFLQSPFYAEDIKFWFEFYSVKPELKYCDQGTLWNNCRIFTNNEPINWNSVYRNWIERGISRPCQIRNAEGIMLSKRALEQKYDFQIDQIAYNSLIDEIPTDSRNNACNKKIIYKISIS